ncbi:MAG: DUF1572 family protein [Phycisphaerales bacterium]
MKSEQRIILSALESTFHSQRSLAEKALAQVPDHLLHTALTKDTNSPAVIVKHMSGNLVSRFTDFLTTDGEKPTRDRDTEFEDDDADRAEIMRRWERGWAVLFATLAELNDADLARTVHIRGEPHSVALALHRALAHQSYHVGQIVQLARVLAGEQWTTLTIPRAKGASGAFNLGLGYVPGPGDSSAPAR